MQIIICLLIGYLLGSILTAVIVCRVSTGMDISRIGSGNPGMANVMSQIGKKEGILVCVSAILMIQRHWDGLQRIFKGTEKRRFH